MEAQLVRARKVRDGCARRIKPGEQYVRSVMFPNHDGYSYIDPVTGMPLNRPIRHDMCLHCADHYDAFAPLVESGVTP